MAAASGDGPPAPARQRGAHGYFGRTRGQWEPYINPVSTAFALQTLAVWSGAAPPDRHLLI